MDYDVTIVPFDAADFLNDDETIIGYLNAILEENDTGLLLSALGDIAKAKGMTQIAYDSGLSRESLYKALNENAKPRFETIQKVLSALGVKLSVSSASLATAEG